KPEDVDAAGRQLDRERYSIEPAANLRDGWRVVVGEREFVGVRRRPLDEEPDGRIFERFSRRQFLRRRRNLQGRQTLHPLAFGAQRLAAGCQDIRARYIAEDLFGQSSGGNDDMFATVEDEQHALVPEKGDQLRQGIVQAQGDTERG